MRVIACRPHTATPLRERHAPLKDGDTSEDVKVIARRGRLPRTLSARTRGNGQGGACASASHATLGCTSCRLPTGSLPRGRGGDSPDNRRSWHTSRHDLRVAVLDERIHVALAVAHRSSEQVAFLLQVVEQEHTACIRRARTRTMSFLLTPDTHTGDSDVSHACLQLRTSSRRKIANTVMSETMTRPNAQSGACSSQFSMIVIPSQLHTLQGFDEHSP